MSGRRVRRWVRPAPDWAERWSNKRSDYGASPYARDEAATAAVKAAWSPLLAPYELYVYPNGTDADIIEWENSHGKQGDRQQ